MHGRFDETPEDVEKAILRGLRYLEREALSMRLHALAHLISGIVSHYSERQDHDRKNRIH